MFDLIIGTVMLRPYVFIFLLAYLFIAITHIGWKRTALFTGLAYIVAFVCEWSSAVARTGFPFGLYHYISDTKDRELWIAGVPFMDSLSFTFLAYTSWELATLMLSRKEGNLYLMRLANREQVSASLGTTLLASLLMMYLDIVIDPVALQGERWFLGKIYEYPNGGSYFGVTIANFLGWFFVCFAILQLFLLVERLLFVKAHTGSRFPPGVVDYPFKILGAIGLYFGILGFNIFMTFRIGELTMGWGSVFISLSLLLMVMMAFRRA
jgi:putative membrane protein